MKQTNKQKTNKILGGVIVRDKLAAQNFPTHEKYVFLVVKWLVISRQVLLLFYSVVMFCFAQCYVDKQQFSRLSTTLWLCLWETQGRLRVAKTFFRSSDIRSCWIRLENSSHYIIFDQWDVSVTRTEPITRTEQHSSAVVRLLRPRGVFSYRILVGIAKYTKYTE